MRSAFTYAPQPLVRRHGPDGYRSYESYRDWLRDDFLFRCVYCLHRERWYDRGAAFHIDHFVPVVAKGAVCEYTNLLYACAACNESKKAVLDLADPCVVAFGECLQVTSDGEVKALNTDGEKLVEVLRLNNPRNLEYRSRLLRILDTLRIASPNLFAEMMAFPTHLPDLRIKQVPSNSKPEGAMACYFALRESGLLPSTY